MRPTGDMDRGKARLHLIYCYRAVDNPEECVWGSKKLQNICWQPSWCSDGVWPVVEHGVSTCVFGAGLLAGMVCGWVGVYAQVEVICPIWGLAHGKEMGRGGHGEMVCGSHQIHGWRLGRQAAAGVLLQPWWLPWELGWKTETMEKIPPWAAYLEPGLLSGFSCYWTGCLLAVEVGTQQRGKSQGEVLRPTRGVDSGEGKLQLLFCFNTWTHPENWV